MSKYYFILSNFFPLLKCEHSSEKDIFIIKMIYISLQLPMWVYRETDVMISTILCYIIHGK